MGRLGQRKDFVPDFEGFLERENLITQTGLDRARASAKETGQPLAIVLVNLGLVSGENLADAFAAFLRIPRLDRAGLPESPPKLPGLSPAFLKAHKVLPLRLNGKTLTLAMANPLDRNARDAMAFAFGRKVAPCAAALGEIEEAIEALYFREDNEKTDPSTNNSRAGDVERLQDLSGEAPVIKFVERTIGEAMDAGASDIHFEAREEGLHLRFRIDGVLVERPTPPAFWKGAVASRVKIMASLNIAETRLPQDGRFKITVRGSEVDFRVATIPSIFGESVVLRLLDRGKLPGDLISLGFPEDAVAPLKEALFKPDGIVLVTGPTGSGKTTTLYSALKLLNSPEKKILTVEDPIEYVLEGANQVQVDPKIGRTFASTLRAFLRQDPDILLVGEIRDRETAEIAIQAALTGHLVLSTLHTNNAAGALTRLLDMGVEDFLIASTVTAIVGQRLVRTLCRHCRKPAKVDQELLKRLDIKDSAKEFYAPKGCSRCFGTGYAGRTGIIEVLRITDRIRDLIQRREESTAIERAAIAEGMVPMFRDGLRRAAGGVSTLEEVLRVTREA